MYFLFLGVLLVALPGCQHAMLGQYQALRPHMAAGEYQSAADMLEASKHEVYDKRDRVMYWLDHGTLLHYAGQLEASTQEFIAAEQAIDELFTKSVSRGTASMLTNPTVTQYEGEDYEKVLLYLYTALNQAMSGDLENALVEVRRADERLKKLEIYYRQEGGIGTLYTQDAFLYWLNGIFFEEEGSHNDALISFKHAYEVYRQDYGPLFGASAPSFLNEDIVRAATRVGFSDVAAEYGGTGADGSSVKALQTMGELIVVIGIGESPYKTDLYINSPAPAGYLVRVALPQFNLVGHTVAYADLQVVDNATADVSNGVLVGDVSDGAIDLDEGRAVPGAVGMEDVDGAAAGTYEGELSGTEVGAEAGTGVAADAGAGDGAIAGEVAGGGGVAGAEAGDGATVDAEEGDEGGAMADLLGAVAADEGRGVAGGTVVDLLADVSGAPWTVGYRTHSQLMEPVDIIATANYAHRLPQITALAVARAITKYAAVRGLEAAGNAATKNSPAAGVGDVLGGIASIVNFFTEAADKRSWRTLPASFQVARIYLPPGTHDVRIVYRGVAGNVIHQDVLENVTIVRGRRTFRSVRCLY